MFYGFVITEAGNRLLAKMVAGSTLTISSIIMDKGTVASAAAARALTAPLDPGPKGTSTVPVVDANNVNILVEYRSDLNGGLTAGFWIGGFGVFAKNPDGGADVMIYYGSLGDAKQYVSAYIPGTAPDVRRYPVSITVTAGVDVTVSYPAEAWMTADEVAVYFNGTLKPDLLQAEREMLNTHDGNQNAHGTLLAKYVKQTDKGVAGGVAPLGSDMKISEQYLPSYVDDVLEFANMAAFPAAGDSGKIYVALDSNRTYRWGGTAYTEISASIALGETPSTAYPGDRGKVAFDHSNKAGNAHGTTAEQIPYTPPAGGVPGNNVQVALDQAAALAKEAKAAAEGNAGGCVLLITFANAFAGRPYTVTAPGENYTGTVPAGLKAQVSVKNCNTTYTVGSSNSGGTGFSTTVTTGPYFGQYPVELTTFSATLRVTTKAGAAVTAVSGGNTYTATADGAGLATLSIKQPGTYAVTATQGGETVSGSVAITTTGSTYNLTLAFISPTLENNSWAKIREVSDADAGENYWKQGDKKAITINGKAGNTTFSNLTVYAFILGFNHNAAREGNHRIHFQIGKTAAGADIALVDSSYGSSVSTTGYFSMNATNTNSGGWSGSQMRSTVLGSGSTPTSPAGNTLLAALPADLRAIMKPCTKYSDNTGGGADTASYVTSTTDYLFLLAEWEYHGARTYANSAEKNYQEQYAYYKAGNSKIKYRHDNTATAVGVWVRSVNSSGTTSFCRVSTDGSASLYGACNSYAVAPGFCA